MTAMRVRMNIVNHIPAALDLFCKGQNDKQSKGLGPHIPFTKYIHTQTARSAHFEGATRAQNSLKKRFFDVVVYGCEYIYSKRQKIAMLAVEKWESVNVVKPRCSQTFTGKGKNMNMLWFDERAGSIDDLVRAAAAYYAEKYGRQAAVAYAHPDVVGQRTEAGGLRLVASRLVSPKGYVMVGPEVRHV